MKIIGKTHDGFIIDINQSELEKIFNSYYGKRIEKINNRIVNQLKVGEELDAGLIYNFNQEIKNTVDSMKNSFENFKKSSDLLMKFCEIIDVKINE